jgi:phage-related protein
MAYKQISWVDSTGAEFPLNSNNDIYILNGLKGFAMPPMAYADDEIPLMSGTRFKSIKASARELDIPMRIMSSTNAAFVTRIRQLLSTFNPLVTGGKIRVTSADGSKREINCRYVSGLDFDEGNGGDNWQKAIAVFRAFDTYWYDVNQTVLSFSAGSPVTFFPFPFKLSPSSVLSNISINNIGDVETYPVWVISGPCNSITIANATTGEKLSLNVTLQPTEYVTIDTRQGKKTIIKSDGTNLFNTLSDDSSLWAFKKGVNSVQADLANSTAATSVQLIYLNKYLGAW